MQRSDGTSLQKNVETSQKETRFTDYAYDTMMKEKAAINKELKYLMALGDIDLANAQVNKLFSKVLKQANSEQGATDKTEMKALK